MKRRLSGHLADLVLGLGLTAVLFGLGELALSAFGIGEAGGSVDISRGFDASAAYIVPDPLVAGGFKTQFAENANQEVTIPPRGPRIPGTEGSAKGSARPRRVLLFGGSNTDNFPDANLEKILNEAAGRDAWEVINLGRSGYGSGRVSIVLEQAVEHLDPDVVVLYSGHNEFVEQSFRKDLEAAWSGGLEQRVARWASGTRIVRAVRDWIEPQDTAPKGNKRPEAWKWEYDKFKGLTYPETLEVYERYRDNLEFMCRSARERGIQVLLCTVVHNHFAAPFESTLPPDWDALRRAAFSNLREGIEAAFPSELRPLVPREARERVVSRDWHVPPEERRSPPLPPADLGSRPCTGPLATAPAMRRNRKRWSEKTWRMLEALEGLKRPAAGEQRGALESLEGRLLQALALCPDHPTSHFELALVRLALGREADALVPHFEQAARFDRAPRRGNPATNGIVRALARDLDGIVLVDAEEIFRARMPMGLVGWEWMSDHCHLNPGAALVFMSDLAEVLLDRAP